MNFLDQVKQLTKDMVAIESIVRKDLGESNVVKYIYDFYQSLDYFKERPDQIVLQRTINDPINRHSCISPVYGTRGNSNKTIILLGHIDTAGVDDYHGFKDIAFDVDALLEKFKQIKVSDKVREDIESGDYLFGRGFLGTESGMTSRMAIMDYFSKHPEELGGNLVHVGECDEEDNSHGIISALSAFDGWKERFNLEYIAAIDADYSIPNDQDNKSRNVYLGTIGKLLPGFYVYGKETHAGEAFGGLDPSQIMVEVTKQMNLNTDLCDEAQNEVATPPTGLKQLDTKVGYIVQIALSAHGYFNYSTHATNPKQVMDNTKQVTIRFFGQVTDDTNASYKKFCQLKGLDYKPRPWKTRIYTFQELYDRVEEAKGPELTEAYEEFIQGLHQEEHDLDLRLSSNRVIEWIWDHWVDDKSPAVIVYPGSIYSAPMEITGKDEGEKKLVQTVKESIELAQKGYDKKIYTKCFYPPISDSSFMKIDDDGEGLKVLEKNMPSWGNKYIHPTEAVKKTNVSVINMGTIGYDGYKATERVDMEYTFRVIPEMLYHTLKKPPD